MSRLSSPSALFAITLILGSTATAAQAGERSGVNWSISVGTPSPAVVYAPPPVVYSYPQQVYVQPQPIYVQPQTVYVQPQAVYVEQAPVVVYGASGPVVYGQPQYAARPRHHHHHNRDDNGGNFRYGGDHYRGRD